MRAYARQAHNTELEVQVAEIKLRALRRLGELSSQLETTAGARLDLGPSPGSGKRSKEEQLTEAGISKSAAYRAEELADIPDEQVEQKLAQHREQKTRCRCYSMGTSSRWKIVTQLLLKPNLARCKMQRENLNNDDKVVGEKLFTWAANALSVMLEYCLQKLHQQNPEESERVQQGLQNNEFTIAAEMSFDQTGPFVINFYTITPDGKREQFMDFLPQRKMDS